MSLIVVNRREWVWYGQDTVQGLPAVTDRAKGKRVVVALASELCFSGVIDAGGSEQEMLYRLEDILPVAAEDVVAGFITSGGKALGIAALRETLQEIQANLSESQIAAVCPLALLATAELGDGTWVMGDDIVRIAGGKPVSWTWGIHSAVEGAKVDEVSKKVADTALKVLDGKARPPMDLRSQKASSMKSPKRMLATAAMVMLAVGIGAMWVRAWRYDAVAGDFERHEEKAYVEVMGDSQVPADMVGRLESEARKLETGAVADVPDRRAMSGVMVEVLGCLPGNLKLEVTDLRLEGEMLSLAGRVGTHRDAEAIAGALRSGTAFEVGSPGTEQLTDGTVSFSISGIRKKGGAQ